MFFVEKGFLLLHLFNKSLEYMWVLDSHLRENFAVDLDTLFLLESNEGAILHAVQAQGIVEAGDPQSAEGSLLGASIAVSVLTGLDNSFLGGTVITLAAPAETFGELQDILSSFGGGYTAFYSGHDGN